jgi:hypothetical protein
MKRAYTSFTHLASSVNKDFSLAFTYIQVTNRFVRLTVFATIFPLFFNLSLSSCSPSDTISPDSDAHSSAREAASILNVDGFENSSQASFWLSELWTKDAGKVSSEQHRAGKQSMRFSWTPNQADGTNKMLHSELATRPLDIGETERWYGYSIYMPKSTMADDPESVILNQWHGFADPGAEDTYPPLLFTLEANNIIKVCYRSSDQPIKTLKQMFTKEKIIRLGTATFDQWVDYVVHVKWDPSGNTGILQVWKDGALVVNEQNISIGYLQQRKPYWKIGIYSWTGKSKLSERIVYYDEARIGGPLANYDAVKPGRNDNSAKDQH